MVTEDYVSFEVAKLLKEKGFNLDCHAYYIAYADGTNKFNISAAYPYGYNFNDDEDYQYSAPTHQMAMKWLREVHNKIIIPRIRVIDPITGIIDCYCIGIYYIPKNNGGALCFISPTPENGYSSYEEACEAAIKYCLENLIK